MVLHAMALVEDSTGELHIGIPTFLLAWERTLVCMGANSNLTVLRQA